MQNILLKMNSLMYGYKDDNKILELDYKLAKLAYSLATLEFYDDYIITPSNISDDRLITSSKVFLSNKFRLHDVFFADDDMMKQSLNDKVFSDMSELVKLYNMTAIEVDPFRIPINFVESPYTHGLLSLQNIELYDDEFLKGINVLIREVELSETKSEFTYLCYIHEIMHMELVRLKGSVENFFNSEIISMFMEFVYAYENSLTKEVFIKNVANRINYFLIELDKLYHYYHDENSGLNETNATICSKYIISTLKTFKLLDRYIVGSDLEKQFIMERIQEVLDGKKTLEDILKELDITYENSLDKNIFIKRLVA